MDATRRNRRGDATSLTTTGDNPTALHRSATQPQALARSWQDSDSTSNKQFVVPSCARCPSTCRQSLFLPNDSIPLITVLLLKLVWPASPYFLPPIVRGRKSGAESI